MSDWIQTFTGKQFFPLNPRIDDICIEDISHGLSMICRFNGQSQKFYSVAEHSILVSQNIDPLYAIHGLLHDSSEAYISDIAAPIKPSLIGYDKIELKLQSAIFERFKLFDFDAWQVKEIDKRILMDEMEQLMPNQPAKWNKQCEKLGIKLLLLTPEQAEFEFLKRFRELTK